MIKVGRAPTPSAQRSRRSDLISDRIALGSRHRLQHVLGILLLQFFLSHLTAVGFIVVTGRFKTDCGDTGTRIVEGDRRQMSG